MESTICADRMFEEYTYDFICQEAMEVAVKYNLNTFEKNVYNHLCQGDFALRNEHPSEFFDCEGGRWDNKEETEEKLEVLLKNNLIILEKNVYDCIGAGYTSWYFYDSRYKLNQLRKDWQTSPYGIRAIRLLASKEKKNKGLKTYPITLQSLNNNIKDGKYTLATRNSFTTINSSSYGCYWLYDLKGRVIMLEENRYGAEILMSLKNKCYFHGNGIKSYITFDELEENKINIKGEIT